ncbi:MAG: NYN domain-containing protein, partial [Acidimicrobiales bacterium]
MTSGVMAAEHVVVDGSNIATEGRSTPSLVQLEEAVAELRKELPDAVVTVVVDATFAHRVDPSELERFEQAALRGEYVYPPAGAIGRGDAFLLRIAERVDGIVLSNDSFQEFHGEHEWLFERGRLLGATPVPGVGWIFVPRSPVRGPRSRVAVRDASRAKVRVVKAIAQATREAVRAPATQTVEPSRAPHARSRASGPSPQAVNDPMTFISFIADHPLGDEIAGVVESFTSHGAVVRFGEVRCYVPLSGLGEPAPRAAREVLHRGEERTFVVTALDPFRRGVELALPGIAVVSGRPSEETVAAEVRMARAPASSRGAGLVEAPVRTSRRRSAVAAF